jgi:hypothetical protein
MAMMGGRMESQPVSIMVNSINILLVIQTDFPRPVRNRLTGIHLL